MALNLVDCDLDTLTGNIRELLLSTAQEVLWHQRKKKQPLVAKDILVLWPKEGLLNILSLTGHQETPIIEDSSDYLLTESTFVLSWWAQYCKDLYSFQLKMDANMLQNSQISEFASELVNLQTYSSYLMRSKEWYTFWMEERHVVLTTFQLRCSSRVDLKWQRFLLLSFNASRNAKNTVTSRNTFKSQISHPSKVMIITSTLLVKKVLSEEQARPVSGKKMQFFW